MLFNPKRSQGTCEWFLRHESFLEWTDAKESRLLLFSAGPGCGKSVLSRFLVEELKSRFPSTPVSYFFFKHNPDQISICNAFSALLHQLLTECPFIVDHLKDDMVKAGQVLTKSFQTLAELLETACRHTESGSVLCVLDALDECDPINLTELIQWIRSYIERSIHGSLAAQNTSLTYLKFIVTTRGYPSILERFSDFPNRYTHVSAEDQHNIFQIQEDIDSVVADRFHQLVTREKLDQSTQSMIWNTLQKTGSGQRTYLWVELIFKALYYNRRKTKRDWEKLIQTPPKDVFEAYSLLLSRVEDADYIRVRTMIHLIYCALRPFTVEEMNIAIHLRENHNVYFEHEIDRMSPGNFREWVIESCGFFVTESNGELYFIHETAREFLVALTGRDPIALHMDFLSMPNDSNRADFHGSFTDSIAHASMAETCILYLTMDIFFQAEFQGVMQEAIDESSNFGISDALSIQKHTLLKYAVENWENHFLKSQVSKENGDELRVYDIHDEFKDKYFRLCNLRGCVSPVLDRLGFAVSYAQRYSENYLPTLPWG